MMVDGAWKIHKSLCIFLDLTRAGQVVVLTILPPCRIKHFTTPHWYWNNTDNISEGNDALRNKLVQLLSISVCLRERRRAIIVFPKPSKCKQPKTHYIVINSSVLSKHNLLGDVSNSILPVYIENASNYKLWISI